MTDVRLAYGGPPDAIKDGLSGDGLPSLLVSYVYLPAFERQKKDLKYREWVMDSGAFSASSLGTTIVLQEYIDTCHRLMETDPSLVEIFGLDVIGDWKATIANTEEMWKQGIPAIPTYHVGAPEDALKVICRDYAKIAIGGAVGFRDKLRWAEQVFARVWPKKIHGFGFGGENSLVRLPFHSVDATNWEIGPCKFGRWASYAGNLSIRGGKQPLRVEVEHYLKLEAAAKIRWQKEMAELETSGPSVRLAMATMSQGRWDVFKQPISAPPNVRLALSGNARGTNSSRLDVFKDKKDPA